MNNMIPSGLPVFPTASTTPTIPNTTGTQEGGFGATLQNAISQVDQLNQDSQAQMTDLLQGNRQDLHNVMIAVEKADVAFQLMMQVRNKIVNAYEEVSKLQF
jgi:flagellar hook-basal body complex protein FliE